LDELGANRHLKAKSPPPHGSVRDIKWGAPWRSAWHNIRDGRFIITRYYPVRAARQRARPTEKIFSHEPPKTRVCEKFWPQRYVYRRNFDTLSVAHRMEDRHRSKCCSLEPTEQPALIPARTRLNTIRRSKGQRIRLLSLPMWSEACRDARRQWPRPKV